MNGGYLVKLGEFWAMVDAEGIDSFRVRIDPRTLATDGRSFDEALAYFRDVHARGAELDQMFAARPGVVVKAIRSRADENVLELDLIRGPFRSGDEPG